MTPTPPPMGNVGEGSRIQMQPLRWPKKNPTWAEIYRDLIRVESYTDDDGYTVYTHCGEDMVGDRCGVRCNVCGFRKPLRSDFIPQHF